MNIGNLYLVKEWHWLLFPTKETAATATAARHAIAASAVDASAAAAPAYWGNRLKCEVTYFSPDIYIVFLEEDGKFKRILTADGKIGWTFFDDRFNVYFEEVKAEE